jgi:hypothetical protein
MLHAYSITLEIPEETEGVKQQTVIAPIPKDMKDVLAKLNFNKESKS